MAIKKNEIYSSLWASCDKLRGGMDASQYKDYILTLLFVKYVTDKFKGVKYADITVPEGGSFDYVAKYQSGEEGAAELYEKAEAADFPKRSHSQDRKEAYHPRESLLSRSQLHALRHFRDRAAYQDRAYRPMSHQNFRRAWL